MRRGDGRKSARPILQSRARRSPPNLRPAAPDTARWSIGRRHRLRSRHRPCLVRRTRPGHRKKRRKKPRTTKKVPSTKSCRFLTRYGSLDGSGVRVCGAARCQAAVRSPAAEAAALLKRWLGLQISIVRSRWGSTSFNCVHSVLRARIHPTACYAAHPVC